MVKPVVAAAVCMIVVACAARAQKSAAPAATETSGQPIQAPTHPSEGMQSTMPGDPRSEIERLSAEIDQGRTELALPEPAPAPASAATPMSTVPLSTDVSCKPKKTEKCTSSCTLSDSICKNAERICSLAQQLAGDTWAADKCTRAKQTCDASYKSCCGCQ